ncbi:MAG: OmpA family protein [Candidatus Sulfotelmatobacter sp.]
MSPRFNLDMGQVVTGILIVLPTLLISSHASAQSDANPKRNSFVGYQWLHPGAVPAPSAAPGAICSVQPKEVTVGEPITAAVIPTHFNPKHALTYVWSPSNGGGKVIGNDTTAQIETTNAAIGSYTVTARVIDVKAKKLNEASCSANFTVKPLPPENPPNMSISAIPMSILAGGTVDLSARCASPDGVPVTISTWRSIGGAVSATGASAVLDTAGAAPGAIAVSATCTDSRGLKAQASTEVMVENSPPPPPETRIEVTEAPPSLHSIYFPTAMPPIGDRKAGLVASQRQTLVALAADFKKYLESKSDAHLILEGNADPRGRAVYDQKLSERRVERVKSFLVEQGVSETDIETKAFGSRYVLSEADVKDAVENDPQLSPEERQRALKNIRTMVLASDRRVDITLSTTGQSSARQFPFNAEDALTLIGGRERRPKRAKTAPKKTRMSKQ